MTTTTLSWNSGLTGPHLSIAAYPGTPLRVMAGPGTGKTFALMRRIARLLQNGVPPQTILAVTFTRTAASDLLEQLNALGSAGADNVRSSTLHSISFSILGKNSVFQATNRVARPLLQFETNCLISDLAVSHGGRKAATKLLSAFETAWATLQHHQPGWPKQANQQDFHRDLLSWLTEHQAMLIGELVPLALDFIRRNPASPDASAFDHVLVDEYQDLNRADQELIESLARNGTLTIIGDEDQSIYTFLRHARPEGIVDFHKSHANTHDEALSECKRCPRRIIEMANSLILHNHPNVPSTITPSPQNGVGNAYIVQHNTLRDEASSIAEFVEHYLSRNPQVKRGEILILATRRLIGNWIRDELIKLGHPSQSFFTEDCLAKRPAQEGLCILRLGVHPNDPVALRAWLGIDTNSLRSKTYLRLLAAARKSNMSVRKMLYDAAARSGSPIPNPGGLMKRFVELDTRLQSIKGLSGIALVDELWPAGDPDCVDIRGFAIALLAKSPTNSELLNDLIEVITQPELPGANDDIIRVMSLQKSKGLTAKCVVIAGCMEGALPVTNSNYTPAELRLSFEEQRRLFYVALTRTTETLVISSAATGPFKDVVNMGLSPKGFVRGMSNIHASQFLSELGSSAPSVESGLAWRQGLGF